MPAIMMKALIFDDATAQYKPYSRLNNALFLVTDELVIYIIYMKGKLYLIEKGTLKEI